MLDIVNVISESRLLDSQSVEHPYWRSNGLGLPPGFYIATFLQTTRGPLFGEDVAFHGPYVNVAAAQLAVQHLTSQTALPSNPCPFEVSI